MKNFLKELAVADDVKTAISEAFETQVSEAVEAEKTRLEAEMVEKLAELRESSVALIEEAVAEEVNVLKEELDAARNLDVTYAEKLAEFKEKYAEIMAVKLQEEVQSMVDSELTELKESIEAAAASEMGNRIFEAFRAEITENFGEEGVDVSALKEELAQLKAEKEEILREQKINSLLDGFTGKKREVMATLLEGVSSDKLEEKFERVSAIVLKEAKEDEETVVTESKKDEEVKGTIVVETVKDEDKDKTDDAWKADIKRRAGIK